MSGAEKTPDTDAADAPSRFRDLRPYIYGGLCIALAIVYYVLFTTVVTSAHGTTRAQAWGAIFAMAAMGVSLPIRQRWGWYVGVAGCGLMLLITIYWIIQLVWAASFLSGVYGAFGKGASSMTYLGAALLIEVVALVPVLLMKYLMTRAGRRSFGHGPLFQ